MRTLTRILCVAVSLAGLAHHATAQTDSVRIRLRSGGEYTGTMTLPALKDESVNITITGGPAVSISSSNIMYIEAWNRIRTPNAVLVYSRVQEYNRSGEVLVKKKPRWIMLMQATDKVSRYMESPRYRIARDGASVAFSYSDRKFWHLLWRPGEAYPTRIGVVQNSRYFTKKAPLYFSDSPELATLIESRELDQKHIGRIIEIYNRQEAEVGEKCD